MFLININIAMKRPLAFLFDIILHIPFYFLVIDYIEEFVDLIMNVEPSTAFKYSVNICLVFYFFLIEIIFKTTPGKLLFGIKIHPLNSNQPLRLLIVARLFLKYFSFLSVIGAILDLLDYYYHGSVWYDRILGLEIFVKTKNYAFWQ